MKFSEKINYLMKKNEIKNLRQLADKVEIPYSTLWDYYSNPTRLEKANLVYIKKIAKFFNCTIDYLVYDNISEENEVVIDGYDIQSNEKTTNDDVFTRFKVKFDDENKINDFLNFLNDNIENYKVEKINIKHSNNAKKYTEILKEKGLMDENENINEESLDKLLKIADIMKDYNKKE